MNIETEFLELESCSCFELVTPTEAGPCKVGALRHGFVHLDAGIPVRSPRRAYSAEPRPSAEAEELAFARYVATFHFASRRGSVPCPASEAGLKTPTGARQKLTELATPVMADDVQPERPDVSHCEKQCVDEGSTLPSVDLSGSHTTAVDFVRAAEATPPKPNAVALSPSPPPVELSPSPTPLLPTDGDSSPPALASMSSSACALHIPDVPARAEETSGPPPPGSPSRMLRADAPAFVPQTVRCVPLSTMPPSSPKRHVEAGARVVPPPPPAPPPVMPSKAPPGSFHVPPPPGHPDKWASRRNVRSQNVQAYRAYSGQSMSGRTENVPPPPATPKLTRALLGGKSSHNPDDHASERDGAALETASHGSCSNSTTAPPSVDEASLPPQPPPPPELPPQSQAWSCGPSGRRRWADEEDRPGIPESINFFSEADLATSRSRGDSHRRHEAAKASSAASQKKSSSSNANSRNMIWRPKVTAP